MTDTITLPREVVEGALEALDSEHPDIQLRAAIALRTHLAAEPVKPSEDIEALRRDNERLRDENRLWKSRCIALVWKGDTDNITAGRLESAAKEIDAALRREDV